MKKLTLILALMLVPFFAIADSQGDNNGKPFQDLQAAIDAALAAEAAAREAGDSANSAEVAAEAAAREAGDAAAAAALAAETLARIEADQEIQAQLDEQELLFGNLNDRVSVLEGLHFNIGQSFTWTETTNTFDVVDLASAIAGLNAQPGEWMLIIGNYSGLEWGICTNSSSAHTWLNQATSTSPHSYSTTLQVYLFTAGRWYSNIPIKLISAAWNATPDYSQSKYIRVQYPYNNYPIYDIALIERFGDGTYIDYEVIVEYNNRGGAGVIGNTATLRVDADRMTACGF